jgi:hypothetical protein
MWGGHPFAFRIHAAPGLNVAGRQRSRTQIDRRVVRSVMQCALAEEATDGGDAMTIAQPRVAVG